jgi:ABC-type lipoprotein release transport system permease subunit
LFETSATDGRVLAGISVLMVIVAIAASVVPAWRAARVDPNEALRAD